MKTFDIQSIGIETPAAKVFDFLAEARNLPRWTKAFKRVDQARALLETPDGSVDIVLETVAHAKAGTIDWRMTFPDGAAGTAYSRVTPDGDAKSIYTFVLMAPPAPLEELEGALATQRQILAEELRRLKEILEGE